MNRRDAFSDCHPAVNFLYYALVLVLSMSLMQPVCLAISLLCASWYLLRLQGWDALWQKLRWLLPVMELAAVMNPAFTHQGMTILTYLPSGNPLTFESILYGLAAAGLLASVILWFSSFSEVMTSDKFIYLFGRVAPALSLVLSMTLRFVPQFRAQLHTISEAQRTLGRDVSSGSVLTRLRIALRTFSILITWSLETAIETADSMKSRGYGLRGRTSFSIFRFDERDRMFTLWLCISGGYVIAGWIAGGLYWQYYPMLLGAPVRPITVSFQAVYLLLCLTPVLLDLAADRRWTNMTKREERETA